VAFCAGLEGPYGKALMDKKERRQKVSRRQRPKSSLFHERVKIIELLRPVPSNILN
jgi:hypothetical protein